MMLAVYSVGITLYALSLAIMAVEGTIRRIGVLFATMEEVVVFVALRTKRAEAFALAGIPAVLVLLFCVAGDHGRGRRVDCGKRCEKMENGAAERVPGEE